MQVGKRGETLEDAEYKQNLDFVTCYSALYFGI